MTPATRKSLVLKQPTAIQDNTALTINVVDSLGFDFLEVEVILGATDIGITVLKMQESDVAASGTALTNGADIVGTRFGTDNTDAGVLSVLPSATDDNKIFKFEIDLRGRKRYLLPFVTIGDGTVGGFVVVTAHLSRGEETPTSAAQKGIAQLMRVPNLAA
jgi:hypothetical protein